MKTTKKALAAALAAVMLLCMPGISATAAAFAATETVPAVPSGSGTEVMTALNGYAVTVLDKTTPAVTMRGRADDRTVMCFVSAENRDVGVLQLSDYNAIAQAHRRVVHLPGGGVYGAPPIDGKSWEEWFADEFNAYRGLGAGSREEAVALNRAETIELYRQKLGGCHPRCVRVRGEKGV